MASAAAVNKAKQMERMTTCPICLDKFRIPKVLPCMHTFCLTPCLTNLVDQGVRSIRCPECRREHQIPPGGIQAFPSNITMIGFMDLQPSPPTTTMTTTTMINLPDRCFVCRQQRQTLVQCQDCSEFLCTDCREPHLRETFFNVTSSVTQLRRALPKLGEKVASHEQRVNALRANYEQIRRDITSNTGALMDELKHRENTLLSEAETHLQSQFRTMHMQQETARAELAAVGNFCDSIAALNPNKQLIIDADLRAMREQCNQYSQQIDALQTKTLTDAQKLRVTFDNQAAVAFSIQDFGQLVDPTQERQQPRFSPAGRPQMAARYVASSQNSRNNSRNNSRLSHNGQNRSLPNFNNTRSSTNPELPSVSQTVAYRSAQNNNSRFVDDSYMDLSSTAPARPNAGSYSNPWNVQPPRRFTSNTQSSVFGSNPFATNNSRAEAEAQQLSAPETSPRRNYVTSMTAARSLEGDDRPIFGASVGGGRGRGRLPAIGTIPEEGPPPNNMQRRGTFVLDEPSLPNLPQSGAQKPRDKVNVRELFNVRRRKRARTPVAFTINLNESAPPSRASEEIDIGTI